MNNILRQNEAFSKENEIKLYLYKFKKSYVMLVVAYYFNSYFI